MRPSGLERRRTVRRAPRSDEPLSRVRLRTGRELTVVNLSASGALVEGVTRLLPNTHTDLHIVTRHGRVLVRARVVRALVWRLERDMACYRTALAFDTAVDTEAAPSLSDRKEPNAGAPGDTAEPVLSEPSSYHRQDGNESSAPALSEASSYHRKDGDESNGRALSEPSSYRRNDMDDSSGPALSAPSSCHRHDGNESNRPVLGEASSYHRQDGDESNGLALSEPSSCHRKDGDESNGPALSEPSSCRRHDEGESNGYLLPAEFPGKSGASGTGYPNLDLDDRR